MNCIYKISNTENEICYIGHAKNYKSRVAVHKSKSKTIKNKLYNEIILNGGWLNYKFNIIIELPIYDKKTLKTLEQYYFNLYKPLLNSNYPERTVKQYQKDEQHKLILSRQKNRIKNNELCKINNQKNYLKVRETAKTHYNKNKELLKIKNNSIFTCQCGLKIKYYMRKKHNKEPIHAFMLKNELFSTIEKKFNHLIFDYEL